MYTGSATETSVRADRKTDRRRDRGETRRRRADEEKTAR